MIKKKITQDEALESVEKIRNFCFWQDDCSKCEIRQIIKCSDNNIPTTWKQEEE